MSMNSASVSDSRPVGKIYHLGDQPPLGVIPEKMHAFCVRQERFGEPKEAWQREIIAVPNIGPKDVLVYTMATGINYNNVWAALGYPVDVIAERQKKGELEDFHAGGSDCAGIVWAVGSEVTLVKVGDEVVVHSGWWAPDDPWVLSGKDPDAGPVDADLGVSDQLRRLLPVHQGSSPSMPGQTCTFNLGGSRLLHALRIDRVSHVDGLATECGGSGRRGSGLGCRWWARFYGDANSRRSRRESSGGGL